MAKYRILIADDQVSYNELIYERLLGDNQDSAFCKSTPANPSEFKKALKHGYDAVLLDVNLDDWGITLKDALKDIGSRSPVVLVSQRWPEPRTHSHVVDAIAGAKQVRIVGTLSLNQLGSKGWENHAKEMQSQLRLAIAAHRRRGLLTVDESDEIRILHLSDPQYGDPNHDHWAFLAENEIAQFVGDELQQEVHLIAITGDITYSGQPHEFKEAEDKLTQLAEAFLLNQGDWSERLLLVPGNHDVNLRLATADMVSYNFSENRIDKIDMKESNLRRYALQPFRDFAWRLTGDPRWRDAEDLCWSNDSFRHLGLRLHLLNSVSTLDCRQPKRAEVPPERLEELAKLAPPSPSERLFSIAFSHHGRELPENPNVEGIENWTQLAKFMQSTNVKLWLHGHGHKRQPVRCPWDDGEQVIPDHGESQGQLGADEILRVMAPTTHLNEKVRPPEEYRGFNLITLERSHGKVEAVKVDSYETQTGKPSRAEHAPWTYRV